MPSAQILVVEDERIVAKDIQNSLRRLGFAVPAVASSAEEALRLAEANRPDLVLMDIMLQGERDGVEAAQDIRLRFDIPAIYLTAHADDATLQRAKITEPFGYILKPFEERELHTAIEMALYKHRMERKLREREQWLATTLNSISDAMIATDARMCLTFINPVAVALTGWRSEEALGKDLGEVLVLLDAEKREPIESPARKVLREGLAIRPAHPAILATRDGREVPLEWTCAPLRDDPGNITGVVLVFRDISERKQAEEVLARQAQELTRSNGELEQFAYAASHDLREPLRTIKSFTQRLANSCQGRLDAEADDHISRILHAADRMQRLIGDLLAYSRIGRQGKGFAPTDCTNVFATACANLQAAVEECRAEVTADSLPTVLGNETELVQLFQNLIGNAIKFRGERPIQVRVEAQRQGDQYLFSVRDNGIGIESQYRERIFKIFERLHGRSRYPGTGIGLAICRKTVELHGGCIWVESEPGAGSTFYFTLPVARSEERQGAVPPTAL